MKRAALGKTHSRYHQNIHESLKGTPKRNTRLLSFSKRGKGKEISQARKRA